MIKEIMCDAQSRMTKSLAALENNLERLSWQSDLILKADMSSSVIGCRKCFGNLLEIFIKTDNFDGLFLKLVEVLEISGLEIIDANISTSSNKALAANTFIAKFSHHDRGLSKSEVKDLQIKINDNFHNFSSQKKKGPIFIDKGQ